MVVSALFLIITLAVAVGVLAVVAVGMGGRYTEKNEKFTSFAEVATKHLNGDAEPPRKFVELVNR